MERSSHGLAHPHPFPFSSVKGRPALLLQDVKASAPCGACGTVFRHFPAFSHGDIWLKRLARLVGLCPGPTGSR